MAESDQKADLRRYLQTAREALVTLLYTSSRGGRMLVDLP
jgi:hypothetical protein